MKQYNNEWNEPMQLIQSFANRMTAQDIVKCNKNIYNSPDNIVLLLYRHTEIFEYLYDDTHKIDRLELNNMQYRDLYRVTDDIVCKMSDSDYSEVGEEAGIEIDELIWLVELNQALKIGNKEYIDDLDSIFKSLTDLADCEVNGSNYRQLELIRCEYCGELKLTVPTDTVHGTVCRNCLESDFEECCTCHDFILPDEDEHIRIEDRLYCSECMEAEDVVYATRNEYGASIEPVFFPDNCQRRYIGTENELIQKNRQDDSIFTESYHIHEEHRIYGEFDSTITKGTDYSRYDGIEFISHPMTLKEHEDNYPDFLEYLGEHRVINNRNSGLHIHVNRSSATLDVFKTVELFIEHYQKEFLVLSRRNEFNTYTEPKTDSGDSLEVAEDKCKDDSTRYHLVNFTNEATVEFRFFASTTNADHYLASLHIINELLDYFADGKAFDFDQWREYVCNHNNLLAQYFTEVFDNRAIEVQQEQDRKDRRTSLLKAIRDNTDCGVNALHLAHDDYVDCIRRATSHAGLACGEFERGNIAVAKTALRESLYLEDIFGTHFIQHILCEMTEYQNNCDTYAVYWIFKTLYDSLNNILQPLIA